MKKAISGLVLIGLHGTVLIPAAVGQTASARVVSGGEHCREIHFPGGWKPTKGMQKAQQNHFARFDFGSPYEFRKTARSGQEYLVAAVDQIALHRDYSENKFWVNLRSGKVRGSTEGEWATGTLVRQSSRSRGPFYETENERGVRSGDGVLFQGKLFEKSGPQWPISAEDGRISPDGKWIGVQSWEGQDYANGDIVAPRGGHGNFFIDLCDVSTGRRFAVVEGALRDTLRADEELTHTFWLESRYFIVQLGSHLERMLVCEVPNQ